MPAGVGDVSHVEASCKVPDEPSVDSPEQKSSLLCKFCRLRNVLEKPENLSRKIKAATSGDCLQSGHSEELLSFRFQASLHTLD